MMVLNATPQKQSSKQAEIIVQKPKTKQNPNIVNIKSDFIEYPKTCHKSSKTIKQAEKVGSCKTFDIVKQKK